MLRLVVRLSPTLPSLYVSAAEVSCTGCKTLAGNNRNENARHLTPLMNKDNNSATRVSLINRYVQSLCGLYSRVARQLQVDRSYVSRVARGERRSEPIERALTSEFDLIMTEVEG